MIRVGIFGATGYTGRELVKILSNHPQATLCFVTSESEAGKRLDEIFPTAPPLPLISATVAPFGEIDLLFLCLPHGAAGTAAMAALHAGVRVIDLSADFRLKSAESYALWYRQPHPAAHLLAEAVYGLTEFSRPTLPTARLVANPGCYPTAILLALYPLLQSGRPMLGPIIADAKSGVSGAGRTPTPATHFVQVADNFSPYQIGRVHRHLPEMEQQLAHWRPDAPPLIFSPHLLPVPRGILATIYVTLPEAVHLAEWHALYAQQYANEPFVRLLPAGQLPTLAHALHTNRCVIGLAPAGNTLILTAAIDNLLKGASGQAVQNMNVMFGLPETMGLG